MNKEYLEQFLTRQLAYMRNLRNSNACLERLAHQAFGACSFVSDCLCADGVFDAEVDEWLTNLWQGFRGQVFEEFGLEI